MQGILGGEPEWSEGAKIHQNWTSQSPSKAGNDTDELTLTAITALYSVRALFSTRLQCIDVEFLQAQLCQYLRAVADWFLSGDFLVQSMARHSICCEWKVAIR